MQHSTDGVEDLLFLEDPSTALPKVMGDFLPDPWWKKFQLELYDWNDPVFIRQNQGKHSYIPVPLTQGYFMMVRRSDRRLATMFPDGQIKKWHAKVQRNPEGNIIRVYACRRGRAGEPKDVYAHVELKRCLHRSGVVDHINGWGLDNRSTTNLCHTSYGGNGSNAVRVRRTNVELPTGVEIIRNGPRQGQYRGIRAKRIGKRVKVFRSKRSWKTIEPAAKWYQNQLRKIYNGRGMWAHNPTSVTYPLFPPRVDEEISVESKKLQRFPRSRKKGKDSDIPF